MSQAIQHNSQVTMTRHPHFLRIAEALRPALRRQAHLPSAVVEARADAAALFGWRAEPVSTLAAFYQRELTSGDSVIIDSARAPGVRRTLRPICSSPSAKR